MRLRNVGLTSHGSCCGPASVDRKRPTHENDCCPRNEDWTVVILDEGFVQELRRANPGMKFPILQEIEVGSTKCVNGDIGCLERLFIGKCNGNIFATAVLHNIQAKFENSETKKVYVHVPPSSRLWIKYPYLESGDIGPGCSGGPILIFDDDSLLGIQCCYPTSRSSNSYIIAPSINLIIFSLYCGERYTLCSIGILDIAILTGGLNIELNLVSILNCLQDMIHETQTLPPPAVLDQVSNSIGKGKGRGGGGEEKQHSWF